MRHPIMDFCPSQPTRRLSRLSLQGAFLVDNFNYGDRIFLFVIRWIVSSVAGAPMVMMLNIAGKRSCKHPHQPDLGHHPAHVILIGQQAFDRLALVLAKRNDVVAHDAGSASLARFSASPSAEALRRASTRGGFHLTASPSQCAKSPAHFGHKSASVWGPPVLLPSGSIRRSTDALMEHQLRAPSPSSTTPSVACHLMSHAVISSFLPC